MILLTGAAGKTGTTLLKHLTLRSAKVRSIVRNPSQAELVSALGSTESIVCDLNDDSALEKAVAGIEQIYFIAPNVSADELSIGKKLVQYAKKHHVARFIYHSVLHPHVELMPHHWQKMRMEETLFSSGLDYTILQPCAYMQNVLGGWQTILKGQYIVPYQTNAKISIVDLDDIAKVAAKVLLEPGFSNAIFELAGPEPLSQLEVAARISESIQIPVQAIEQSRTNWETSAIAAGLQDFQRKVLIEMFEYYDKFDFVGNSSILEFLLGEKPTTFKQFLARISNSGDERQ